MDLLASSYVIVSFRVARASFHVERVSSRAERQSFHVARAYSR